MDFFDLLTYTRKIHTFRHLTFEKLSYLTYIKCQTTGAALHTPRRTALLSRFGLGCYQEVRQWLLEQNLPLMVAAAGLMAVQVSSVRYHPLYQTVKVGSILLTLCTCSQLDKRVYGHFV